ncbi:Protein kinase superfamily protein [Forsythia ovata]|uniref:Protein kinase superfamily protein n=1 Tax=Forsythia ovata TaxID=205694 RepID=A0ABD1TLE8_9LAMI
MEWGKRKLRLLKRRKDKMSPWYMENGSKLLEGLIASSNGEYDVPYRVFTIEELYKATYLDITAGMSDFSRGVMTDGMGYYISGTFQQRSILVKKFWVSGEEDRGRSYAVNDIVIALQMNRHKNVLKVLGCCLDLKMPAIIYEHGINYRLLFDILFKRKEWNFQNDGRSLSWSNRLKIAADVANAIAYLHTAFPTPIIHRDLTTKNIVIDNYGVAKLVDFSLCISLPPGESEIKDMIVGTKQYLEPEYARTGIVTEKCDVYMFGMILIELLTGREPYDIAHEPNSLEEYIKEHVDKELSEILDPTILVERGEKELDHQLQAFLELALRCTCNKGVDRPDVMDMAKELQRIQRSSRPC